MEALLERSHMNENVKVNWAQILRVTRDLSYIA